VKRREKNFSARTALAASEGWKASQNTNSWRFLQTFEFGKHKPPILVSTLQHDVFETLKPAKSLIKTFVIYSRKKMPQNFNLTKWGEIFM